MKPKFPYLMNRFILYIGFFILLDVFPATCAFAQKPQVEEVTIVGSFNPTIADANKILRNPVLRDTTIAMPPLTYNILSRPLRYSFPVYSIEAQKVAPEPDPVYSRNYLRAGFGSLMSPAVDFFASKPLSKRNHLGVRYSHLSAFADIKEYSDVSFSSHQAEIYGKSIGKTVTWMADAGFSSDMLHHYGFKTSDFQDTVISPEDTRQTFTRASMGIGLSNTAGGKSALNFSSYLRATGMTDRFDTREFQFSYSGSIDYQTGALSTRKSDRIGIRMEAGLWKNQWETLPEANSFLLSVRPFFQTEIEEYELYAGLNTAIQSDSSTRVFFFPELRGGLTIVKEILKVYAGIRGDVRRHTFDGFTKVNPFLASEVPLGFERNVFEFYGGVNTSLGRYIGFNASVSNSSLKNIPFFINDTGSYFYNRFIPVYDSGSCLRIQGELSFHKRERIHITLGATYTSFELENQFKAWHSPELVVKGTARVAAGPSWIFKASLEFAGESYARVFEKAGGVWTEPEPIQLKSFVDLSLGLEYRFSKKLSAWADFNNLTGGNYQRWNRYPVYGINAMAGITYSF